MESNTMTTPGYSGSNGGQNGWPRDNTSRAEIVEKTQQAVGQLADQVRGQVKSQLEQQKERVAENVEGVAGALHAMSRQLREQDQTAIAEWTDSIGESASRVFNYLADKDVEQLAGEVEQFARRQPALFLTGAFALGLMASRFFKSSGTQNNYDAYSGTRRYGAADSDYPAPSRYGATAKPPAEWAPSRTVTAPTPSTTAPTPVASTSAPAAADKATGPLPSTTSVGGTATTDTAARTSQK